MTQRRTRHMTRHMTRRGIRSGADVVRFLTASLLLAIFPVAVQAQATGVAATAGAGESTGPSTARSVQPVAAAPKGGAKDAKLPKDSARRRAAKLYLAASKLYANSQFEQALSNYERAATLDPMNPDYRAAVEVTRSHAVAALVQSAAKARLTGDESAAREALERARAIDPTNPEVTQHLYELADHALQDQPVPIYQHAANTLGEIPPLLATAGVRSFHMRTGARPLIEQVFRAYGIIPMLDDSVPGEQVRLDIDNADFATAAHALGLVTGTFYVPLDSHRVLVARDTRENRQEFTRKAMETISMAGLSSEELTEASNLARNVFGIEQVATDASNSTVTLRGAPSSLEAFNANMRELLEGHDQVMLDMNIIQLANTSTRNTGVTPPQSISAFNVYAEEQSILNANQSLVQQIISSGLASPNDPLAILGILLASGQVSSSLFSGGIALFGGGLTQSALAPGPATFTFSLNSSDSRVIDNVEVRLGDGEAGTIKDGTKYPIQTSSYSSLSPTLPNIPGLTGAGSSGSLSSLLSSLGGAAASIPMIQYQDLGLTLKVTPNVLRGGDVALTVDLTIDALSGESLNGNPILNHQAYSGVVTLKAGQTAELASELDKSESLAISGTPGLSEVPGMNNVTDKNLQKNYATLLIQLTPHVLRATQPAGHTPPMVVEKTTMVQ